MVRRRSPRKVGGQSRARLRFHEVVHVLREWTRRIDERQALRRMTELELHDFGASKSDALIEARKPFWRK